MENQETKAAAYDNMLVTNTSSLPNIKNIHGIVSAYNYFTCGDTFTKPVEKEELLVEIETVKKNLVKRLKYEANAKGGNAIIGFTLDIKIDHSNYLSGMLSFDNVAGGQVSIIYSIGINVYGTAVTVG